MGTFVVNLISFRDESRNLAVRSTAVYFSLELDEVRDCPSSSALDGH